MVRILLCTSMILRNHLLPLRKNTWRKRRIQRQQSREQSKADLWSKMVHRHTWREQRPVKAIEKSRIHSFHSSSPIEHYSRFRLGNFGGHHDDLKSPYVQIWVDIKMFHRKSVHWLILNINQVVGKSRYVMILFAGKQHQKSILSLMLIGLHHHRVWLFEGRKSNGMPNPRSVRWSMLIINQQVEMSRFEMTNWILLILLRVWIVVSSLDSMYFFLSIVKNVTRFLLFCSHIKIPGEWRILKPCLYEITPLNR